MLQVRKSRFAQYCFMSETQVLMTVSDFFCFFSRNHFLEGGFTFERGGGLHFEVVRGAGKP